MMSTNTKATDKYKRGNYDTITFPMLKGERQKIREHVETTGESYQSFLRRAVINQIAQDRYDRFTMENPDTEVAPLSHKLYLSPSVRSMTIPEYNDFMQSILSPDPYSDFDTLSMD